MLAPWTLKNSSTGRSTAKHALQSYSYYKINLGRIFPVMNIDHEHWTRGSSRVLQLGPLEDFRTGTIQGTTGQIPVY